MFDFFRRPTRQSPAAATSRPAAKPTRQPHAFVEPLPVPEVVEGNEQSDWELWEDSVSVADSRFAAPSSFGNSQMSDVDDPFAKVGKNRDL